MFEDLSDAVLDHRLRDVPVPVGLVARLQQVCLPDDDEIDEVLRSPPVPDGLVTRLQSAISDEVLSEQLRDVEVPGELLTRLRTIPFQRERPTWKRLAMAASLLMFLFGTYCGAIGALLAAVRPPEKLETTLTVIDLGPVELESQISPVTRLVISEPTESGSRFIMPSTAELEPTRLHLARLDRPLPLGPAGHLLHELSRGLPLADDIFLMRWEALGSPQRSDEALPQLTHVRRRDDVGVDLPLVPGYDRAFLLKSSTHPPVRPAAHAAIASVTVPLSTRADSFELTRRLLTEGRQPHESEIRVEDFLAVVRNQLPSPTDNGFTVQASGGPTLFGQQAHHLLHIGIRAPRLAAESPLHLSIVLDVSASMRGDDRIGTVQRAVSRLRGHLGPDDSLSLVAVNHEISQQIDFLPRNRLAELLNVLTELHPAGGDNLALGLQAGMQLAFEAERGEKVRRRVVVITDGRVRLREQEVDQMRQLMTAAKTHAIGCTVIELDNLARAASLSAALDVVVVPPRQLTRQLVALAIDRSPLVARHAQLHVAFNPQNVLAYRLVGHGPTAMTGLGDHQVVADLYSNDETSVLFEVWLRRDSNDEVARVQMEWTAPSTSRQISAPHSIRRLDFATSFDESPLPLQVAAMAAEVGQRLAGVGNFEVGQGAKFIERRKPKGWQDVLNRAQELQSRAPGRTDIGKLRDLAKQLEGLRGG